MITVPIVLVLALCGGLIAVFKNQADAEDDWRSSSAPIVVPSAPAVTSAAPSPSPTLKGTVVMPAKLAGRSKLKDAELAKYAKELFWYEGSELTGAMVFYFKSLSAAQREFVSARGQVDLHS